MAKSAEYSIVINGIKESIDGIQSINKQLDALEKRLDVISKKNITVSVSGGGNTKALDEEAKMLQQIEQLHQKVAASEREEYQELLHAKEELKEYQTIAKSLAAQDNLKSGTNNLNTMQGMKAQLHDLKAAMQTVDINGDQFRQWAAEANELNQKLKEVEQSYGVFSRDVGNYSNGAYEGIKKFSIEIGGVTKEFESAKKALKELKAEMQTLQYKQDKGIITEEETERFKSLVPVVRQLESAIQDAGKPLDNMLDTMQSLVAIASVGQGLSALFGLDESEIEKTIQKLVALQNVLQGLQTIQNQITSKQGIGLFLSKGSGAIDSLTKSIFGVTAASKNATIAVKLFSGALKGLGFGLVMAGLSALIDIVGKWITKQQEAKKAAEELRKETNKNNAALQVQRVQLQNTLSSLESFNGSKKEEERIVKSLNSQYGQALGTYKTIAQWKDALKQKTDAYIESLELEFEMQQAVKKLEDAYLKKQEVDQSDASDHWNWWNPFSWGNGAQEKKVAQAEADKAYDAAVEVLTNLKKKIDEHNEKNQINIFSPQDEKETKKKIKDNSKKIEDAVRQAENNINDLRLRLMRDGLYKELMLLDEENRREIDKIKKNGQRVEEQLALQEAMYQKKKRELTDATARELEDSIRHIGIDQIQDMIDSLDIMNEKLEMSTYAANNLADSAMVIKDISNEIKRLEDSGKELNLGFANSFETERLKAEMTKNFNDYYNFLMSYLKTLDAKEKEGFIDIHDKALKVAIENGYDEEEAIKRAQEKMLKAIEESLRNTYVEELKLIDRYGVNVFELLLDNDKKNDNQVLTKSIEQRIAQIDAYYKEIGNKTLANIEKIYQQRRNLLIKKEDEEKTIATKERDDNLQIVPDLSDPNYQAILENNQRIEEQYDKKITEITERYANEREKIRIDKAKRTTELYAKYYDDILNGYDNFQMALNNLIGRQPIKNSFGIVNIGQTRKQLREAYAAILVVKKNVEEQLTDLENAWKKGLISPDVYKSTKSNLQAISISINDSVEQIEEKLKGVPSDFVQSLQQYIQAVGQAANTLISAFGDLYNYNIQKELDALDEMNEKLQDKYDEQKEIEERHKNEIESIEDELATSRGDRRQQLIDQLNAEMQARREAAAEQKRIEAEMARNQRKQEELEKKQKKAEYKRNLAQILVNGAMAVSQAAVNPWPMPAKALMALAAALTAAQYAIAKKQKPYAKGGLLEGPSHKHGGIPVGNTGIEVEGKEYVIRKESTAKNVNLLDFINKSRRKLTLSDFIDYYEGRKNNAFRNMSGKYAEGGQLPTMPNIDLGDVMTDVAILRDNRPIYVAVTDINKKQDDVRRVQVLSGLK